MIAMGALEMSKLTEREGGAVKEREEKGVSCPTSGLCLTPARHASQSQGGGGGGGE